jgi:hypothetical protein
MTPTLFQPVFRARFASDKKSVASKGQNPQKNKKKGEITKKKKKLRTTYVEYDLKDAEQFSLCDAMRYVYTHMANCFV